MSTYKRKTLSMEQAFLSVKNTAEEFSTMPLDAIMEQKEQTGPGVKFLLSPG